jgi:hypothetical protein
MVILLTAIVPAAGASPEKQRLGSLRGSVVDAETGAPIIGASVLIVGTSRGASADSAGQFKILNVPVGTYAVRISSVGHEPSTRTDVIVRAGRATFLDAELEVRLTEVQGVSVGAGYFNDSPTEPTSSTRFSAEEVRRAPGSAGDVSRIMFSLPSVAKVNDQVNNLIVRGGNPTENSFYVDNIEIPNINHYPLFGTSGGPISLVNTDFVKNVDFSAGGFSAAYGDRLSSVMALSFREGDREKTDLQADFNFAGIGLVAEGPIVNHRGSWLVSARRSYLDLLVDAIGVGVVPKYSDYQGKFVYDLSPRSRISILGILGVDYINFDRQSAIDEGNITDGWSDGYEYAVGANWRYLWGKNGYSNTSVSHLATRVKANYFETSTGNELVNQNNLDGSTQLRNVNFFRLNDHNEVEFGTDLKYEADNFDYYASAYTNYIGDSIPPLIINDEINSPKVGGFVNYIVRPSERFSVTLGTRFDYFDYTGNSSLSPRLAMSYNLSSGDRLNAAFGMYSQTVPIVLLSQQKSNRDLQDLQAYHYILGYEHMLNENTRLRVETYYKWYKNFPMNIDQPELFIIDEVVYGNYFFYQPNLRDDGKARSYGVEATVQKKLKQGIYGLLSGAWFRSQYKDLNGTWRNRAFDNRVILSAEGGYKPNNKWEFSLRWIFAGGAPYTPLDLDASQAINRSVYDETRVNEVRYPDYHSLNLRADRRFNFANSNMIVFFSVWNAYNRKNVATYYWNEIEKKQDEMLQWSMLPILGVEFEF